MLAKIGLLTAEEENVTHRTATNSERNRKSNFRLDDDVEDIHSQVEAMLTEKLGERAKNPFGAFAQRSGAGGHQTLSQRRNYSPEKRDPATFELLQQLSERYKDILLPGYTRTNRHAFILRIVVWSLRRNLDRRHAYAGCRMARCRPESAGFCRRLWQLLPLDREMTTRELGFATLHYNVIAAQMARGKTERILAQSMASIASTLNKLAADNCMYLSGNYGFISYPDNLTTGSSIMPHKKIPTCGNLFGHTATGFKACPTKLP